MRESDAGPLSVFEVGMHASGISLGSEQRPDLPTGWRVGGDVGPVEVSRGPTSLALEALGVCMCTARVYDSVQESAEKVAGFETQGHL